MDQGTDPIVRTREVHEEELLGKKSSHLVGSSRTAEGDRDRKED